MTPPLTLAKEAFNSKGSPHFPPSRGFFRVSIRGLALAVALSMGLGAPLVSQETRSPGIFSKTEKKPGAAFDGALKEYEAGYKEYRLGHFREAELHFKEALSLEPNLIKAHYWLGKLCREMGRLKESVFHDEEVLRIQRLISERRIALSYENNEYPALAQIEITREREKKAEEAYQRGQRFLDEGHWEAAIAEFKTSAILYPGNKDYLVMLARILWDKSDFQGAAKYYSDFLDLRAGSREGSLEAISRLISSDNKSEALRHLRHLVTEFPGEPEFTRTLRQLESTQKASITYVGKVLQRQKSQVILDFGLEQGLKLADEYTLGLRIFRPGDPVIDPGNGNELGRAPDHVCGNVLVTKVFKSSCWALIQQEFGQGVKAGDLVEIKSPQKR